jgi:hypothetical protein
MHMLLRAVASMILLSTLGSTVAAQTLTGTVSGTIRDQQGGVLPGVTVSLTGPTGTRTSVSDESGIYRFPAVDPATYSLTAELSGFQTNRQENIVVTAGTPLTIDLSLGVGGLEERVNVVAESRNVSVTSSQASQTLSQDILFNLPISRTNAAVNLLNNLPGVTNGSAYGGGADSANSLQLDGVDTRDPEAGTAWTFFNYNIVQEVEVKGLGAPAEYGGFTGAVVNAITKSGGNLFSGLFDITYTGEDLASSNISDELIEENPALGQPDITRQLVDYTTQFGGPIMRDKAFFYVSAQRYYRDQDPAGPRTIRWEVSPRFNAKLTLQPGLSDQLMFTIQADDYNVRGRPPTGLEYVVADEITNREDAPEWVWLAQWRHLFGSKTFFEVKYTGYNGYFDLNPEVEEPGHYDVDGSYSVSQGWFALYDRDRNQVNASVSHYAEGFGQHDLKFGAEIERSSTRNRYGYVGGTIFYDYGGAPYLAYQYGYDVEGRNDRQSFYAQDSWHVNDRVTINPGIRFDWIKGSHPALGKIYDTKNFQPRIGVAYDVTGNNNTVLRAHYGQYYEAAFTSIFTRGVPGIEDYVTLEWNGSTYEEIDRVPALIYHIDDDIKHPRVDEFMVGVERAIGPDLRFQATGVFRDNKNLIDSVFPDARWSPVTLTNSLPSANGATFTGYAWANPNESEGNGLIMNPKGFQYLTPSGQVIGTADPFRKYRGLILALNKRFTNRWQGNISYVLSKAEGTVDNTSTENDAQTRVWENPSLALINRDGNLRNDRRHEFKVYGTYQVPVIDVGINAIWLSYSGRTWTPYHQYTNAQLAFPPSSTGRRVFLEPRGTSRMPWQNTLDLRFDKQFRIGSRDRISAYVDVTNFFNNDTILDYQDRSPDRTITGVGPIDVGAPLTIIPGRQVTFGGRWAF